MLSKNFTIHTIAFLSGFIVLSLELLIGRILAPQFGDTVVVWGSIIGVIILSMSSGYWLGGLLVDNTKKDYLFYSLIGFLASVVVLFITKNTIFCHPIISSFVLGLFPGFLAGFLMPQLLSKQVHTIKELGHKYGSLSAINAIGSVLGVFATIFYLLPVLGVDKTLWLLTILSLFLVCLKNKWLLITFFVVIVLSTPLFFLEEQKEPTIIAFNETVDVTLESAYGPVRVYDNGDKRTMMVNGGVMGAINKKNTSDLLRGWEYIACMQEQVTTQGRVYTIGLGPGMLQQRLVNDGIDVTAVEINPEVVSAAQEYFGLSGVEIRVADARADLNKDFTRYDAVLMDVMHYDEHFYRVPPHLLTKEFFELVNNRLVNDGLFVIHLPVSDVDRLVPQVENTILEVFPGYKTQNCRGLQVISTSQNHPRKQAHEDVNVLTDDKMLGEVK